MSATAPLDQADSAPVTKQTPGEARRIQDAFARAEALGYKINPNALATLTGLNRQTTTKMINGDRVTLSRIEQLEKAVAERDYATSSDREHMPPASVIGATARDDGLIEFRIGGSFGVEVIVKCSPDQLDATVAAVEALVERMGRKA